MSFHVSLSCFLSLDSIRVRPVLPKPDDGEQSAGVTFTFEDCLRAASAATHISGNNQKKTKIKILEKF